jgi:cytochrome c556
MTKKFKTATLAFATTCAMLTVSGAALSDSEKRFAESQYRHDVMEHFSYAIKALQQNLRGTVQHPDHFAPIAAIMANAATMTKESFEKDTRGIEGRTSAEPEIWDNWDDFASRMDQMEEDTAAFAEAAKSGDKAQILPAFKKAVSHCKSCHDKYKAD